MISVLSGSSYSYEEVAHSRPGPTRPATQEEIFAHIRELRDKEVQKLGRKYPGTYLHRSAKDTDLVKHMLLVDGVPSIAMRMIAHIFAPEVGRAVYVGPPAIEQILSQCKLLFPEARHKDLLYAHEGPPIDCREKQTWTLSNTISRGQKVLGTDRVVYETGDIPLLWNYSDLDADANSQRAVVLDLNSRQNIFRIATQDPRMTPFPRYFHYTVLDTGDPHQIKEPNVFVWNVSAVQRKIEKYFGMRKTNNGGLNGILSRELCHPITFARTIRAFYREDLQTLCQAAKLWYEKIVKKDNLKILQHIRPHVSALSAAVSAYLGAPTLIKARHRDPGRIEDIDAVEDLALLSTALHEAPDIFPHHEAVAEFRQEAMPRLAALVPIYEDFTPYMNWYAKNSGLPEIMREGRFVIDAFPQFDEEMVQNLIETHHAYNQQTLATAA